MEFLGYINLKNDSVCFFILVNDMFSSQKEYFNLDKEMLSLETTKSSNKNQFESLKNSGKEPVFQIVKAPDSIKKLWENAASLFVNKENIKPHDDVFFSKWNQLSKLWKKNKVEGGHYERKESVVISSDNKGNAMMQACRKDMQDFCVKHLRSVEEKYNLGKHVLTMESSVNPTHTLRVLHYFDNATAIAHCDTSIMTCLYYRAPGLELKVDGKWVDAPILKDDEMLISYGVPGEILSNGHGEAVRHRVKCDERYAVAYFHNTPKDYTMKSENYHETTMAKVYQEAQMWYANVNARVVRHYNQTTDLSSSDILWGWAAQLWNPRIESPISKKA